VTRGFDPSMADIHYASISGLLGAGLWVDLLSSRYASRSRRCLTSSAGEATLPFGAG
jgi:hypothetical protein